MNLKEINQSLGERGCDKQNAGHQFAGWDYLDVYERLFAPIRDLPITLLEIGVLYGGSLRMWRRYFPKAKIVGMDINPEAANHVPDKCNVFIGDQSSKDDLWELSRLYGPFDVIIDDGSHVVWHILKTMEIMWPLLRGKGIYVVEDLAISHHPVDPKWPGMSLNTTTIKHNRSELNDWILKAIKSLDMRKGDIRSIQFYSMMMAVIKT